LLQKVMSRKLTLRNAHVALAEVLQEFP